MIGDSTHQLYRQLDVINTKLEEIARAVAADMPLILVEARVAAVKELAEKAGTPPHRVGWAIDLVRGLNRDDVPYGGEVGPMIGVDPEKLASAETKQLDRMLGKMSDPEWTDAMAEIKAWEARTAPQEQRRSALLKDHAAIQAKIALEKARFKR
jgi:hypothetical protein